MPILSKKLPAYFWLVLILAGSALIGFSLANRSPASSYETIRVERSDLSQTVSVTGQVEPVQSVNLAFEIGGRVAVIAVEVGDKVRTGEILARLEDQELQAQLLQAEANLNASRARLDELTQGTRPEEIAIAQTAVDNAERQLENAQKNLATVKKQAETDLQNDYAAALTELQTAVTTAKNALLTVNDLQDTHFYDTGQDSNRLASAKEAAVLALLGTANTGRWQTEFISTLNGGLFGRVLAVSTISSFDQTDALLTQVIGALNRVRSALDSVPIKTELTSAEKDDLVAEKSKVDAELTALFEKQQAVRAQRAANEVAVAAAETKVTNAANALASARDQLALKQAGSTQEEINAQKAQVESAAANVRLDRARLQKTILRSPINGVLTKNQLKVGEIIAAHAPALTVISENQFEIKAHIPEVDIAKIKPGQVAAVTLDAYGDDRVFQARVTAVDPAETIIEGVATYQTTFQFENDDGAAKSGMTANIDIVTAQRENVLAVPRRAIINNGGGTWVRLLDDSGQLKRVPVETGLRASDGRVEITAGLREGERLVTFINDEAL